MSLPCTQPAIAVALKRALSGSAKSAGADWKPQLHAADVQFSADAAGQRLVLGGGPSSTVRLLVNLILMF